MEVKLSFINTGYCTHPQGIINPKLKKMWVPIMFPSTVGVVEHPKEGVILFDTGYAMRNYAVTRAFPERLYSWILPMTILDTSTAVAQLKQRGIFASEVTRIILSHFHADHIGGVRDFPNAKFSYQRDAYENLKKNGRIKNIMRGFLPKLLPDDFESRSQLLELEHLESYENMLLGFEHGWDILDDGSLIGIPLSGHAEGHIGLLVRSTHGEKFLIADAAWSSQSVKENITPAKITRFIMHDFKEYCSILHKLNVLAKSRIDVEIIPCHCGGFHTLK